MKALLSIIALILCSCVGKVQQLADGSVTVNLPFAARADRFAVNADDGHGRKLKVLVANGNAESVPNNALNLLTTAIGLKAGVNINNNNNAQKNYSTAAGVAGKSPTILTNTDPATGAVTQTAIPFVPPPIPK